jgi:hypothetical protein
MRKISTAPASGRTPGRIRKRIGALAFLAAVALTLPSAAPAEPDAWFHPERYRLGGHGGPWAKPTTLDGGAGVMGGGVFGISTNPGFSWIVSANYLEADTRGLSFGYGAAGLETAFRYRKRVQPTAQFQLGYGVVSRDGISSGVVVGEAQGLLGFRVGYGEKILAGIGYREAEFASGVPGVGLSTLDGWEAVLRLDYGIYDAAPDPRPAPPPDRVFWSGFYSGKWTRLGGHAAWLDGGGTTVIFGSGPLARFAAGISGYRTRGDVEDAARALSLGYGGLLLRAVGRPGHLVHPSASLLLGAGGLGSADDATGTARVRPAPVADADLLLETNLTGFLRMALGAGYRFVPARFQGLGPVEWGGPCVTAQWATAAF